MKVLITGAAGFIGHALCSKLIALGHSIVGIDNINGYYSQRLKFDRLKLLGIYEENIEWNKKILSREYPSFNFFRMNLQDREAIKQLFQKEGFDIVINLAAQAGVRYSIENPLTYIESNIDGFINILEGCRHAKIKHLIFASSSSVYGLNGKIPYSEHDATNHPVSLYAATKKSNELMAHAYSHLYGLPTTGLRFFTVYGPWGRPDMSPFLFIDAILHGQPIKLFNYGDMYRDFTYIDDIIEGIVRIIPNAPQINNDWNDKLADPATSSAPYQILNIGGQHKIKLIDYVKCIESIIGKEATKEFLPMQPGDVYQTYADSSALEKIIDFVPQVTLEKGLRNTVDWFKNYYNL